MHIAIVGSVHTLRVGILGQGEAAVHHRWELTGATTNPLSPRLANLVTSHERQVMNAIGEVVGQVGLQAKAVAVAVVQREGVALVGA